MTNRFFFVTPMFNAANSLQQMLHSVFGQSYGHWHIELIDDCSDVMQRADCRSIVSKFEGILRAGQSINVTWNHHERNKRWETDNVLYGISRAGDDDIVCRLDADDYLCDLDALRVIDQTYRSDSELDCLWTAHRWFDQTQVTSQNISGPLRSDADPYKHPWVSSHLKTFRKRLINDISDVNFRGEDGEYVRRAGDQALYLPILNNAKRRGYLPMVTYAYRCQMNPETFQTDDARFQRDEALFLRRRGFVK